MILKLISSHPSRIQTYDISLLTGAPSVPKNEISKLGIPNDVRLNSNLFDDRWQWEMDSAIGFQVCNKGSVLMLFIDSVFKKYFI